MKETLELRIDYDYANLLFKANEGKNIGTSVRIVELSKDDPLYKEIPIIADVLKRKFEKSIFFGLEIKGKNNR